MKKSALKLGMTPWKSYLCEVKMKNKLLSITEDNCLTDDQKVGEVRYLAAYLPDVDEDRLLTTDEAKQVILDKHCSPETEARDITITDAEEDLLEAQDVKTALYFHNLTQQLIDAAVDKARVETLKEVGEWLTDRPFISFTEGVLDRKVSVKEIALLRKKGEIPR